MDNRVRIALAGAGLAAYAWLSYLLMSQAPDSLAAIVVVLGPMVVASLASIWGLGQRALTVVLAVAVAWLAWSWSSVPHPPTTWIYLAQHVGIHLALALWFGGSLRADRTALITQFALRVHALSAGMDTYTRNITLAWTLYFAGMVAVSLGLFVFGPFEYWTLFANVLTPLSLVAMFLGEYVLRYRLHPEFERVGIMVAVRAYRQSSPVQPRSSGTDGSP